MGTWKEWVQVAVVGELWVFFVYFFSFRSEAFSFFQKDFFQRDNLRLSHPQDESGGPSAEAAKKELGPSIVARPFWRLRAWTYLYLILLGLLFGMLDTFHLGRLRHGGLLLIFLGICACILIVGFLSHFLSSKVASAPSRPSFWDRAFGFCLLAFLGLVFAFDWRLLHGWLLVITIVVVAGAALSGFIEWRSKRSNSSSSY